MSDETTEAPPEPMDPLTDDEIMEHARNVITNHSMLADVNDHDWQMSLTLILGSGKLPPNTSTLVVVPMGPHMAGRWLNGRVPGVTLSAKLIPVESAQALLDKIRELAQMLYPETPTEPEQEAP